MEKWAERMKEEVIVPDVVFDKMEVALDEIEKRERREETKNKKKLWGRRMTFPRVAAIVGIVLVLGSGSVYAASRYFGIRDFVKNIPKEADGFVDKEVSYSEVSEETEVVSTIKNDISENIVTFQVKETLADATSCYILVEADLKDSEKYILVLREYGVTNEQVRASDYYEDAYDGESFTEYAKRKGKQLLLVDTGLVPTENSEYLESIHGEVVDECHGLLCISLAMRNEAAIFDDGTELMIRNEVKILTGDSDYTWEECKAEQVSINLKGIIQESVTATYSMTDIDEMRVEDSTVIINSIKLTTTPLETKVEIEAVNEDKEVGNGAVLRLIDDDGAYLSHGASDGCAGVPDKDGRYKVVDSVCRMDLPDHVNVRVKNLITGEILELYGIPRE